MNIDAHIKAEKFRGAAEMYQGEGKKDREKFESDVHVPPTCSK